VALIQEGAESIL